MSVKWISGLWQWVSVAAVVSLAVTATALIIALAAANTAGSAGRELSQRLLPANEASAVLLAQYLDQQMYLRTYMTIEQPSALRLYRAVSAEIPAQQEKVAVLVRGYRHMPGELAAASAAWRVWLARVVGPMFSATAQGDFARARVLQANIMSTRPYTLAIRLPVAALQAQLESMQARVTARLVNAQGQVIAALAAVCVVGALIAVGSAVAVRRWLLAPFSVLRTAVESVAAGHYETRIPTVGPAELADLGRSTELMRTRLATALADARRAEERFRGLFHSSPDATLTVAADGSIVMVNAQAEQMFGYSFGELAGRPVEMLVPAAVRTAHPGMRAAYFADPRSRQMGEGLELWAVRKDGQEFRVEISLSSLPGEAGVAASATVRDISDRLAAQAAAERLQAEAERERAERRRQQSERLESLSELLGGFTCDFNNLLNVITGYTDLIAEQVKVLATEDSRMAAVLADVEQVREGARRATKLTRQLLIFARRDVMGPDTADGLAEGSGLAADAPARGRREKILLIEDEPSLWQLASRILIRNGYQVCDSATAADALREAGDLRQPIDLLLTDTIMPDMPGTEVAARVRALRPGLPVLYMSGYAHAVLDADGALGPNVDFMEKPFSEAEIVARVRQAIDGVEPDGPVG
jgi:PAS domain S-box-containing protein